MKYTIGNPIYKSGDIVEFDITINGEVVKCIGEIYIVDSYGTFEQEEEPSYDILVHNWRGTGKPMLCKHIRESALEQEGIMKR